MRSSRESPCKRNLLQTQTCGGFWRLPDNGELVAQANSIVSGLTGCLTLGMASAGGDRTRVSCSRRGTQANSFADPPIFAMCPMCHVCRCAGIINDLERRRSMWREKIARAIKMIPERAASLYSKAPSLRTLHLYAGPSQQHRASHPDFLVVWC